jgi:hypothetical protein
MGKMVEDGVASIFGKGMWVLGWELIVLYYGKRPGKYS